MAKSDDGDDGGCGCLFLFIIICIICYGCSQWKELRADVNAIKKQMEITK